MEREKWEGYGEAEGGGGRDDHFCTHPSSFSLIMRSYTRACDRQTDEHRPIATAYPLHMHRAYNCDKIGRFSALHKSQIPLRYPAR